MRSTLLIAYFLILSLLCQSHAQIRLRSECDEHEDDLTNWRTIDVIGENMISTLSYNQNCDESSAECSTIASFAAPSQLLFDRQTFYSAPCRTNVTAHDQLLTVDCVGNSEREREAVGFATIRFYANGSTAVYMIGSMNIESADDKGTLIVSRIGQIRAHFLAQSTDENPSYQNHIKITGQDLQNPTNKHRIELCIDLVIQHLDRRMIAGHTSIEQDSCLTSDQAQ